MWFIDKTVVLKAFTNITDEKALSLGQQTVGIDPAAKLTSREDVTAAAPDKHIYNFPAAEAKTTATACLGKPKSKLNVCWQLLWGSLWAAYLFPVHRAGAAFKQDFFPQKQGMTSTKANSVIC